MKKFNGSNFYTQEVKVQMNLMHQTSSIQSGSNRVAPAHLFMKLICLQKATKAQSNQTNSDFLKRYVGGPFVFCTIHEHEHQYGFLQLNGFAATAATKTSTTTTICR